MDGSCATLRLCMYMHTRARQGAPMTVTDSSGTPSSAPPVQHTPRMYPHVTTSSPTAWRGIGHGSTSQAPALSGTTASSFINERSTVIGDSPGLFDLLWQFDCWHFADHYYWVISSSQTREKLRIQLSCNSNLSIVWTVPDLFEKEQLYLTMYFHLPPVVEALPESPHRPGGESHLLEDGSYPNRHTTLMKPRCNHHTQMSS